MGPQHPSTHGVLRLILELDGETVTECRCGIGYLHTGIEKNMEYRTWVQGVTFCTRMDYLSPFYNEAAYCMAVERLLDIESDIPEKARLMRILLMEINRISSHLVAIATGGMEIGALTVMTIGFRERELCLDLFELITGLRMNHGVHPPGRRRAGPATRSAGEDPRVHRADEEAAARVRRPLQRQPDLQGPPRRRRLPRPGRLPGARAPPARCCGPPATTGTCAARCRTGATSEFEFDVVTWDTCDSYGRFRIRLEEMWQSLRIVEQVRGAAAEPRGRSRS